MGSVGGMFFCVGEIGGFIGPLIIGALVDMTGAFLAGTAFLASLSLVIFAFMLLLKKPRLSLTDKLCNQTTDTDLQGNIM